MTGGRILVNLATMRRGGGLTHMRGFLPQLVEQRPEKFDAVVPEESADLVAAWGMEPHVHSLGPGDPRLRLQVDEWTTRRRADGARVLLSPMNHGPTRVATSHILWACNMLYFVPPTSTAGRVNAGFAHRAMKSADLVVYPSMSIRLAAERTGISTAGRVLHHPLEVGPIELGPEQPIVATWSAPEPLRILVPSSNQPHKNLRLLRQVSDQLTAAGVKHRFFVTAELGSGEEAEHVVGGHTYDRSEMSRLRDRYDVVFIPSLLESYSYPLVEFEHLGFPVAASAIGVHQELRRAAVLFDPQSANEAADALLAAAAGPHEPTDVTKVPWRWNAPDDYASAVSESIDKVRKGQT